ncbi:MAG: VanZ family protein [Defluviitaleaceae bacterium]|nr:VanZ family protein [Defluviitaleaceae bacterium]
MKIFWPIMSLFTAVGIFFSSSIHGYASGNASMGIAEWVRNVIPIDPDLMNFLVRKGAHFTVYFILGFCVAHSLKYYVKNKKSLFTYAWGIAALYGVFDEFHQYFIPGRVCSVWDMLINAAGAMAGVAVAFLIIAFFSTRHK